ncbi:MAG: hemolysin III family protein [Gammaproteobacteria bacterium]|nr:hemolysin III family protein [Gammaproteobacteria bacterium]
MYRGEIFNSVSHLVGAVFAVIGASVLITYASLEGDTTKIVSYSIYGVTLTILYVMSTLYHSFKGKAKQVFQRLDHLAIYLLIAGTYTPFALVAIEGSTGWWLFGAVWSLAVVGIVVENLPIKGPRILPIVIYLAMGWACVFTMDAMIAGMSPIAFNLLVAGGVIYSVGVIFYVLDHWFPVMHGVWHLFVLGGSVCHYFSVFML